MNNFNKMYDISRVMKRIITPDDLIAALFADIPELNEFTWSVTSEYNDNDYSTYTNLTSVNGRLVNYEAEYEDGDEELPSLSHEARNNVMELVNAVGEKFGYADEHTASREDYIPKKKRTYYASADKEELQYVTAWMKKSTLPKKYFENLGNVKWANYYAMDHGRFSPELEFKIYAQEGRMWDALQYACCIGSRLAMEVENYFILNAGEDDKKYLQIYMNEFVEKSLSESPC